MSAARAIAQRAPAGVIPPVECSCCGALVAQSTTVRDPALGGSACVLCRAAAEKVRIRLIVAQGRQSQELECQLKRIVRDVRGGADAPTFDQPDFS